MIEVPVITHELLRAAAGNPITVRTLDGQDVVLRLATPEELLRFTTESRAVVERMLGEPVSAPPMTRGMAEDLCAPLTLGSLR